MQLYYFQIMPGYLKNDSATAQTIIDDWLHTGDIGYYDQVASDVHI